MGQVREVDAISEAIAATEVEIAGEAWGNEETGAMDETGDRSLEALGEGLEGQHEADEESEETEGEEEAEGEEGSEDGEEEGEEGEGSEEPQGQAKPGEEAQQQQQTRKPEGRVPSGKLREAQEARRLVEAERDQLKTELEALKKAPGDNRGEIETLKTQVATLTQLLQGQNRQPPAKVEQKDEPAFEAESLFENPKGFVDHITATVQKAVAPIQQQLVASRVETSMAIAHGTHKAVFEEAFAAMNGLNPQNADDRATVQRIYNAPNPGEELVRWHKRQKTLAEVGDDPAAFREKVQKEAREALLKDPEFRKQLLDGMRAEAGAGEDGTPRTTNRLPKSLARQSGSNLGSERMDHRASDDSEQSVADAAWR